MISREQASLDTVTDLRVVQQLYDVDMTQTIAEVEAAFASLNRIERLAQEWEGMTDTKYRYVAACIRGAMRGDDMAEQAEQTNLRD